MKNEREIVWKFVVEGKKVEVIASTKKMEALVELGLALGVGGQQKKSILNSVYQKRPRLIGKKLINY